MALGSQCSTVITQCPQDNHSPSHEEDAHASGPLRAAQTLLSAVSPSRESQPRPPAPFLNECLCSETDPIRIARDIHSTNTHAPTT